MISRNVHVYKTGVDPYALFYKEDTTLFNGDLLENWLKDNKIEDHELWTFIQDESNYDIYRCKVNKSILKVLRRHKDNWTTSHSHYHPVILVDPVWKLGVDYYDGLRVSSDEYRKDYEKYTGEGYRWLEINVVDYGPKTEKDWKYEFGDITHEQYWGL